VAEGGARLAREDSRGCPLKRGAGWPAHGVDVPVDANQATGSHPVPDRLPCEADSVELRIGDVAVLLVGDLLHSEVDGTYGGFGSSGQRNARHLCS